MSDEQPTPLRAHDEPLIEPNEAEDIGAAVAVCLVGLTPWQATAYCATKRWSLQACREGHGVRVDIIPRLVENRRA